MVLKENADRGDCHEAVSCVIEIRQYRLGDGSDLRQMARFLQSLNLKSRRDVMTLPVPPPSSDHPPTLVHVTSADADEHCAHLGRWRLDYDQISPGAFSGSFVQLSLSRLSIFREITSQQVRQCGRLDDDSFGIGLPCHAEGPVHVNGACVAENALIVCFDADIDMCTPRGFEFRGITMSTKMIEELAAALDIDLPADLRHQMRAIAADDGALARLRTLLSAIDEAMLQRSALLDDPAACRALQDSLLIEIMDIMPSVRLAETTRGGAARKRIVDRACDMMLARSREHVSILDICKAVGASPRKLSYCFQDVLGTSPINYWRAIRLNRARRALKTCRDPRTGIYDIAARYGFWHFSQFSLDYKRHFAELPSETLRRARMC